MGLGPSGPPPHTSLRCGYGNGNNSRAGQEETHHPGLRGEGSYPPTPRVGVGGRLGVRWGEGSSPGSSVQKEAEPSSGWPSLPWSPPEMLRWACPQALDTRAHPGCEPFTAPSGSSLEGADLRPSHLLGQYAHHVWPDPGVRHDRRPPPQIVPPGTPTPWPSLSPGVSTLPPLSASACLSACLSVCPSPSGCLISTSLWIMKPGVEGTQANLPVSAHGLVDQARARETPRAGWGQLGGRSSRNREGTHSCAWGERVVRLGAGQAGWFLQWRMGIPPEGSGQPAT